MDSTTHDPLGVASTVGGTITRTLYRSTLLRVIRRYAVGRPLHRSNLLRVILGYIICRPISLWSSEFSCHRLCMVMQSLVAAAVTTILVVRHKSYIATFTHTDLTNNQSRSSISHHTSWSCQHTAVHQPLDGDDAVGKIAYQSTRGSHARTCSISESNNFRELDPACGLVGICIDNGTVVENTLSAVVMIREVNGQHGIIRCVLQMRLIPSIYWVGYLILLANPSQAEE